MPSSQPEGNLFLLFTRRFDELGVQYMVSGSVAENLSTFREGGSQKHLRDIQGILRNSLHMMDRPELDRMIRDRGLIREWEQVKL